MIEDLYFKDFASINIDFAKSYEADSISHKYLYVEKHHYWLGILFWQAIFQIFKYSIRKSNKVGTSF